MNKTISTPIKIAAFLFLVGGILNSFIFITNFTVSFTSASHESLRGIVNQIIQIITIVSAALSILIGWFLVKTKRWAYILGLIFVILGIALHILVIIQVGETRWYGLGLSVAVLILLIVGRKDFKKS